ncbi:MAG: YitT family protein [Tidjanibacter sp.]|nr:YitT family protein [Tidjanibacter sp.]
MKLSKPTLGGVFTWIKDLVLITIGVAIYAFAWTGIINPANGMGGGATGFARLVCELTGGIEGGGVPIGVTFFIFNAVFLIICVLLLGAKFGVKTIYAIFMTSVLMTLFENILPVEGLFPALAQDKLLSSILGGIVMGFGVASCLLMGGSTGGSDLIAMIVTRYLNLSYSQVVVFVDIFIIGSSYFVFGNDIMITIYGFLTTAVFGYASNLVLSGDKQSLQIFVFSKEYNTIADVVSTKLERGVTLLHGTGYYSKQDVMVVMIVCRKSELGMMMRAIKSVDNKAFISVANVMGVYGEGFDKYKIAGKKELKAVKKTEGII